MERRPVFELQNFSAFYGTFQADPRHRHGVAPNRITALIGPSGSGKSTILRWLNRMNDLVPGAHMSGEVLYHGVNLYDKRVDPVEVRRRIGMVFQKPNPFPKSIYDNVAFGPRVAGYKGKMDDLVEERSAARRSGTRSRTSSSSRARRCPAASSSGCASPARSPSSRT